MVVIQENSTLKYGKDDPWRRVRGKLPRKKDIPDWSPEKLLAYINFIDDFTSKDPDSKVEDNFNCTPEHIKTMEAKSETIPYYQEFLARINVEVPPIKKISNPDKPYNPFHARFITFVRTPLSFLKQNPSYVSKGMYDIMVNNNRMDWATRHFTLFTNELGNVVVKDTQEYTDPKKPNAAPNSTALKSPQVVFNESLYQLAEIYQTLLSDIKPQDLRKLTTNQKLQHVNTLTKTLASAFGKYKPNNLTFNQINVNSASKNDLEDAILSYQKNQD